MRKICANTAKNECNIYFLWANIDIKMEKLPIDFVNYLCFNKEKMIIFSHLSDMRAKVRTLSENKQNNCNLL